MKTAGDLYVAYLRWLYNDDSIVFISETTMSHTTTETILHYKSDSKDDTFVTIRYDDLCDFQIKLLRRKKIFKINERIKNI